jgi:hypothetical protein
MRRPHPTEDLRHAATRRSTRPRFDQARRRRDSRDALEFHHVEPFARAQRHRLDEISLRCRARNRHAAIQDFGSEWMTRFRTARASRSSTATGPGASSEK